MRGLLRVAVAALFIVFLAATADGAAAERYVAMGDSYSAGNGTKNADLDNGIGCERSSQAYGPLIKKALGADSSFRLVACSGAVTGQMITDSQNGEPPQVDRLGNDTLDVTLSIGGNDAGFSSVLVQCGLPLVSCDSNINDAQTFINQTLPGKLDQVYTRIRQKAPQAKVGVVGYPRLFPANGDDCSAATFFSADEIARLNQTADMMADVTRARARAHGFTFIDSRGAFKGHAWCEDEWINGLSNPTSASYHPNPRGYQGMAGISRDALLAAPSPGTVAGKDGRFAFTATQSGHQDIHVMNADGSHPVDLTPGTANDRDPAFSPDGERIAFSSNRSGDFEIWTMDIDGGDLRRLTQTAGSDTQPSWSPNGRQVVFVSDRDGDQEIYKLSADGGALHPDGNPSLQKLTDNTVADSQPRFSPDGSEIAFVRGGADDEVYKMSADGQGQTNLSANTTANDRAPAFSPDGATIAFQSNRAGNFEIYAMPVTGGTATRRTTDAAADQTPVYSPAGGQIAFVSDRGGTPAIWVMSATGSSPSQRTLPMGVTGPVSWQSDARPPAITIESAPAAVTNQTSVTFAFSADERGSTFECRVDSGSFAPCASPYSGLFADGPHQFAVRATDPAGNRSGQNLSQFTVDTAAALTTITSGPSGPTADARPAFSFVAANATFECRLVGLDATWTACTSPWAPAADLADDEYRFEVKATDTFGNVEASPQTRSFSVDTVAPEVTIGAGPDRLGRRADPRFEFSADEAGARFECSLDQGGWTACTSPHLPGSIGDGEHLFEVRAIDSAGNSSQVMEWPFAIDTAAPTTTITASPGPREDQDSARFEFEADEDSDFECRLDSVGSADWRPCASPADYPDLSHGRHVFQVRATDRAGNQESQARAVVFGIDTDPGYTLVERPDPITASKLPRFEYESDDPAAEFECRLDWSGDPGQGWGRCLDPMPTLGNGTHRFEARAKDYFGEVTVLPPVEWVIDADPPTATIVSGPPSLDRGRTATFWLDPGREGGVSLECRLDGNAWVACPTPQETDGRQVRVSFPGLLDADHELRVRSRGALSGPGPVATHLWRLDATPPQVNATNGPARLTRATEAKFEFSSAEPGAGFECSLDSSAFAACQSPFAASGLADGEHQFQVRATDQAGNVSAAVSRRWAVDTRGPVVTIQTPSIRPGASEASLAFAADEPGSAFECQVDGRGWEPCISPLRLTGLGAGRHSLAVRATDPIGNVGSSATQELEITKAVRPPSIRAKSTVRLGAGTRSQIAVVKCPDTACRISAKLGSMTVKVRPARIAAGGQAKVSMDVTKTLRKKVKRKGAVLVLSVSSSASPTQKRRVRLR